MHHLEAVLDHALNNGAILLNPLQIERQETGLFKQAAIAGWGDLSHTLIEDRRDTITQRSEKTDLIERQHLGFNQIDHVVLNVAAGDLEAATQWYCKILGFHPQQNFDIQTDRSALRSQVLIHPDGDVKFPINEPSSANSQIQEFLEANCGPGIQHLALQTNQIVKTVAEFRKRGLPFLEVPATYYTQLQQQQAMNLPEDWPAIQTNQILVDWQIKESQAILLQIFTQPIFQEPTFFFEFIERRFGLVEGQKIQAQGFGEGNFRALFEAIEREQMKRGSLQIN